MDETNYVPGSEKDKDKNPQNAGAHSTVRKGGSDYTDGENVTHYLGNDDYEEGNKLEENPYADAPKKNSGKVAGGNKIKK